MAYCNSLHFKLNLEKLNKKPYTNIHDGGKAEEPINLVRSPRHPKNHSISKIRQKLVQWIEMPFLSIITNEQTEKHAQEACLLDLSHTQTPESYYK